VTLPVETTTLQAAIEATTLQNVPLVSQSDWAACVP
jgi:hypothetical protein